MHKKMIIVFLLIFVGCFFIEMPIAHAETDYNAKITIFAKSKDVKVLKMGQTNWEDANVGMDLKTNDEIKTAKDSFVELKLDNVKNIIRIKDSSQVKITQTLKLVEMDLKKGDMLSLLKDLKSSDFKVKTPTAVAGVRGTGFESITKEESSTFKAHEESIYVRGIDEKGNAMEKVSRIDEGFSAVVERLQNPSAQIEIQDRDREQWNTWKNDLQTRTEKAGEGEKKEGAPSSGGGPGSVSGVGPARAEQPKEGLQGPAMERPMKEVVGERAVEKFEGKGDVETRMERIEGKMEKIESRAESLGSIDEERQAGVREVREEKVLEQRGELLERPPAPRPEPRPVAEEGPPGEGEKTIQP